ncbi:hypothetical protein LC092_03310 [Stappia stellulata]|uniref:hypothetical protein n=1 Tax=Stappia stellulata TaxID=71235 RepID=UPI001CD61E0F|nr:hypothetical protein [Stappia stellulata]MCA1241461.1 hypothetical protein [Stappia stellulata]
MTGDFAMIFGSIRIDTKAGCVVTHRDSYLMRALTVVSVRRPLFAGGLVFGAGLAGFGLAFGDLLYPGEIAAAILLGIAALGIGWETGQLKLLSRDLRGTDLSGVIWGRYGRLNTVRREIVDAIRASDHADDPSETRAREAGS